MFFHTQLMISTLLAVSSVLAAPGVKRQDAGPACNGLGTGAYSNRGNFRIAAFNPNGPNDHEYGTELVQGTTGASTGLWMSTLTVGAWDNATWVNHDMANGGITQLSPGNGVCFLVPDNEAPYFGLTNPKPAPAEVWCGVPSNEVTGEHKWDYLAAHGRYDLWSLCEQKFSNGAPSLFRVGYNVDKTKPNSLFDVNTCVPVFLTILT